MSLGPFSTEIQLEIFSYALDGVSLLKHSSDCLQHLDLVNDRKFWKASKRFAKEYLPANLKLKDLGAYRGVNRKCIYKILAIV